MWPCYSSGCSMLLLVAMEHSNHGTPARLHLWTAGHLGGYLPSTKCSLCAPIYPLISGCLFHFHGSCGQETTAGSWGCELQQDGGSAIELIVLAGNWLGTELSVPWGVLGMQPEDKWKGSTWPSPDFPPGISKPHVQWRIQWIAHWPTMGIYILVNWSYYDNLSWKA